MKRPLSSRDWFGKASAGLILGFLVALGASGLFRFLIGAGNMLFSTKGQLAMWLIAPVWALVLSLCFLFRSTARAWGGLALVAGLVWGVFALTGGSA